MQRLRIARSLNTALPQRRNTTRFARRLRLIRQVVHRTAVVADMIRVTGNAWRRF